MKLEIDYDRIAEALTNEGVIVLPDFLPSEFTQQLLDHVSSLPDESFKAAGIGRNNDQQLNQQIRSDHTRWLSNDDAIEQAYLKMMDECRLKLNQRLFMGLFDYEAHFTHYAAGSYYHRHLDAFKGSSNRILSTVFYLNTDWQQQDGGELLIYQSDSDETPIRVLPEFGTMAIFLSERFPHEVLPANRDRYSIAGWFRINQQ
ncbi:MAG: 2OG-Fe(II) oxygenase [Methylophagaceae bacterium]